ncbi:MAG: RNA polymerase sigma factor [Planctomycetes bacterium]|nr:RNA polymerase sigma factor [Planctomycetota bacterium]
MSTHAALERFDREAMLRFCRGYLGSNDDAEDAVQEIACKVLEAGGAASHPRAWLYALARNHCLNALRTRARRRVDPTSPSRLDLAADATGHLTRLVREENRAHLGEAVAKLTESQREILLLRYVEDLSRDEIAEALALPVSIVKSRLFEALESLRAHI